MKIYVTTIFSFLCIIGIHAQKLNVESFVVKTNDITARTQPRQDINEKDCALVKVQLAAPNAVFKGNVIGDVAYNTSEYLVYMAQGSKKLTVKLEGYLPLEVIFQDYDTRPLEPKTVYQLTISGVMNSREQEPVRTKTGWIILDSEPSGASVYINDEFVGNTPLNNYKQAYGTYQYRLESPNYHPATGIIELNAGRFAQKVVLKPAFGSISVKSSIAGAKIVLDGKQTGKQTPATLTEIPSGSHTISLQMDKYAPRQQEVIVEDGQTANVTLTLDARFARIAINSLDGAEIYSNGKLLGKGCISEDMMEGYYDLEARLNHHKSVSKQIQVVAGQPQEITLNPIPQYGSLDIISEPGNAFISVDGKEYGKTPITVENLLEGQHQFYIKLDGYADYKGTVNVIEDENASVTVKLSNLTNINITSNNPNEKLYNDRIEQGMASGIQTLDVKSFVVKSNDITARTQPRQDINGNDCALVKVQLAAPNAVFEGNVIGDVAYNTSEYLVYMAQGSKKLTVKLEGYLPLEVSFQDYGIRPLEPKTVYQLTISGVMNGGQEPVRTKTGWIVHESEPLRPNFSNMKIVYVEVDSLMTQYDFAKEYSVTHKKKSDNARNTLTQKGKALQKEVNIFQQKLNNNGFTSREQAASRQAAIERQQRDLQELQTRLENELANETAKFNETLRARKRDRQV